MKALRLPIERDKWGVRQAELAQAMGLTKPTMVDIERGRVDVTPTWYRLAVETCEQIARDRCAEASAACGSG